jgi:hypothetical protein
VNAAPNWVKNCPARVIVRAVVTMSKNRKTPGTTRINSRKVEAPMIVTRPTSEPAHEEIAQLAYERFLARGRVAGFQLEDWLAAEAELRERAR